MVEVNWSRQIIILVLAAVFAFYWTGKQGLWEALRGSSPWDKDWADAKQALTKRVSNKYEANHSCMPEDVISELAAVIMCPCIVLAGDRH